MSTPILVTTAIEAAWGSDEDLIFAGEWCLLHSRKAVWSSRNYRLVPNVWDDRARLNCDAQMLRSLRTVAAQHLAAGLNTLHELDLPVSYWQVIAEPWLSMFLSVAWDRWITAISASEVAASTGALVMVPPGETIEDPPRSTAHWLERVATCDHANAQMFADAFRTLRANHIELRECQDLQVKPIVRNRRTWGIHLRDAIWRRIRTASLPVYHGNRWVMQPSGLGVVDQLKIAWLLKQLPDPLDCTTSYFEATRPTESRGRHPAAAEIQLGLEQSFGSFVNVILPRNLPRSLTSDFQRHRMTASQLGLRPNVICAGTRYWLDDPFKIWAAEMRRSGARLVALEHGGGLPPVERCLDFEEEVFDTFGVWTTPFHPRHRQIPSTKIRLNRRSRIARDLLIVACDFPRYSYRLHSGPIAGQVLGCIGLWAAFIDGLGGGARAAARFRAYHKNYWDVSRRISERFGVETLSKERSYSRAVRRSRLIVCTYPQTTFSEALASGPALLLYEPSLWETRKEFQPVVDQLSDAGVIHCNPISAANFVNARWSGIENWWRSAKVTNAVARYFREVCLLSESRAEDIGAFLHHERHVSMLGTGDRTAPETPRDDDV